MNNNTDLALLEPFWRETVERTVLPNGLTLLVKPDHSASLVSVQVWVKTGSIHEGAFLGSGVSHFLEHMLFKGSERRAGREISAVVQAHGGYINAYTTFDRTVYYIDLPSEHCGLAIDVLADAVLRSTLPADEFEKEREVIRREIAMTRDDPDQRLSESLFGAAFQAHPYRHPIIGHSDVFSTLSREELLAYYRDRYVPNNIVVVVAGSVNPIEVAEQVKVHFGAVPRARLAPVLIPEEPLQRAGRAVHLREAVELTRGGLGWQIPGLTHEDAPVLDLLAMLLGSGDSSPLWQTLREKARLVHSIDAHCWNPGTVGLFFISYTTEPDQRERAVRGIHALLARFAKSGFTPAQRARALRQLIVGEINTRKTMAGQASRLGAAEVVAGDLAFNREYFQRLGRVTDGDLRRAIRTYLAPARLTEVSSSPVSKAETSGPRARRAPAEAPVFEEVRLPNGARILFQKADVLPNVHLRLMAQGGPLWETQGRRGSSALLTTLLTKDTLKRRASEVARRIESVGGVFYPSSGNNSVGVAVEVLPSDLKLAVETLSEAVLSPSFRADTLETERESQLAELRQELDDVVSLGRKLTRRRFFGDYPLALDSQGDEAGVKALTAADLKHLWKALATGPNVVLAVAGAIDRDQVLALARPFLSKLPRRPAPRPVAAWSGPAQTGMHRERQEREQAVVFHAFPGPSVATADFYVGEVADELFSGMASRLFERVREEKGLAYFVRSARVTGLEAGMFYFMAGTAPGKEEAVAAEIEAEVARVASGAVEATELARCQARLVAARRQSMQTNSVRALNAGINALLGHPVNDGQLYENRILSVNADVLADFARRYLDPSRSLKVWV